MAPSACYNCHRVFISTSAAAAVLPCPSCGGKLRAATLVELQENAWQLQGGSPERPAP